MSTMLLVINYTLISSFNLDSSFRVTQHKYPKPIQIAFFSVVLVEFTTAEYSLLAMAFINTWT